ncbi:hypothetical protein RhiXN_08470 [Rhizoctonia solani]|uniref:Uncharacterized protein n=1 Tax=Rhizoctonia solani TaxID=456999 RepID=A0A8H8P0S5_9AGAM|nr:uncharacterized protein RhiXN_08470 [Rhizoctonia solani]QRW23434.1 hypothetical protein RhiXN_08470 [Rhizoctonia solani]
MSQLRRSRPTFRTTLSISCAILPLLGVYECAADHDFTGRLLRPTPHPFFLPRTLGTRNIAHLRNVKSPPDRSTDRPTKLAAQLNFPNPRRLHLHSTHPILPPDNSALLNSVLLPPSASSAPSSLNPVLAPAQTQLPAPPRGRPRTRNDKSFKNEYNSYTHTIRTFFPTPDLSSVTRRAKRHIVRRTLASRIRD